MTVLVSARLQLVPFAIEHLEGLHAMNSDPEVMRFISGQPETLDETRAAIERVQRRWLQFGYSWWSFIERDSGQVVGAGAIQNLRWDAAAEPDAASPLELGWRLRRDRWHRGLATEAARVMAAYAFDALRADELLAVCHPDNAASAAVMKRLGMQYGGVQTWYGLGLATYRITAGQWQAASAGASGPTTRVVPERT